MSEQLDTGKKIGGELSGLVEDFVFSLYNRSDNTRKTYAHLLKDFTNYAVNNTMTLEILERYVIHLKKNYRQSTVNLAINALKSFYSYVETKGYKNLAKHLQTSPELPPEQRILSKQEYDIICNKITGDYKDCFVFLCNTGLRVCEFISLRRENVSNGFLRVIGKGRKNRSIPLNSICLEIIKRCPGFEFIRGRNEMWIYRMCQKIAKDSNIPKFHPHSCRHFFANELYHKGCPMSTVSRLLGHSCTMVTEQVYVHWSEESLAGYYRFAYFNDFMYFCLLFNGNYYFKRVSLKNSHLMANIQPYFGQIQVWP